MNSRPTIGFLGSGSFAARCLSLISARIKPEWVITSAAKPAGRGMQERATPVEAEARKLEIPFCTTGRISRDEERLAWIKENLPDLLLVIDFGHMIKEPLLSLPPLGCLNIHPSLLPAYRGSAPVQRAILDGLDATGVTIFRLDAGMDSGPVLARREVSIEPEDDSGTLLEKCAEAGTELLLQYICDISPDSWSLTPQPESGVSYAPKIEKAEAEIDWSKPAAYILNQIRAMYPSPVAYTTIKGKRLKILRARLAPGSGAAGALAGVEGEMPLIACGDGLLKLETVQPEGKKEQSASDWLRGARLAPGCVIFSERDGGGSRGR